ncbi:MAG TPA: hypothetical protein VK886_09335 [Vicinamibacterales bacterium]|nr:hypothetical protein [Vicinamibacterales bacterium]
MSARKDRIGKPADENAASSSTQSASGLGGGTPAGGPSQPHGQARRVADDEQALDDERLDDATTPTGGVALRSGDSTPRSES